MTTLIVGLALFLGIHSLAMVAPAWRERAVARLGELPWKGLYSILSLVGFLLILQGYDAARMAPVALWAPPLWTRHLVLLLMLPVFVLLLAAYLPGRIQAGARHPMLAATKLWAFAHLLANGNLADVVLFGSFLIWAVADRISLGRRVAPAVPGAPAHKANDLVALVGGIALYVAFVSFAHTWLMGVSPLGAH